MLYSDSPPSSWYEPPDEGPEIEPVQYVTTNKRGEEVVTCTCCAYDFPHRARAGQCREETPYAITWRLLRK